MPLSVALFSAAEEASGLPFPSWMFGVLALVVFALLLGVTWSFRHAHQKWAPPAGDHSGHGH